MTRLRRLADEDAGFTIVELLVAILLLGIVGTITVTGLVRGMQATRYSQARVDALADSHTGLERMSREARAADPLREAEADRIALDIRRGVFLHHFQYEVAATGDGWELVEERWRFDDPDDFDDPGFVPTEAAADRTSSRVLVPDLADDEAFAFLDADGDPVTDPGQTRYVEVRVEREVEEGKDPIEVSTTISLRNR